MIKNKAKHSPSHWRLRLKTIWTPNHQWIDSNHKADSAGGEATTPQLSSHGKPQPDFKLVAGWTQFRRYLVRFHYVPPTQRSRVFTNQRPIQKCFSITEKLLWDGAENCFPHPPTHCPLPLSVFSWPKRYSKAQKANGQKAEGADDGRGLSKKRCLKKGQEEKEL